VALVEQALDEELLFREARARGLDRSDRSVRQWLIEQMRVLADDDTADDHALYARAIELELDRKDLVVRRLLVQKMRLLAARAGESEVSDEALRRFYAEHEAQYRRPDHVTAWHVFLASQPQRDAQAAAATLLASLRAEGTAPADAVRRGDPFPVPPRLVAQSPRQLDTLFGANVAARVLAGTPGTWLGPLRSPTGAHLFWIEARADGAVPPFEAVRGQVLEAWRQQRRSERLAALLAELRQQQPLYVDSAAWQARRGA
jgi:PPIC-type PPIASE domain